MTPFRDAHAPRARPITSWCGRGRRRTKRRSDGTANRPSLRWGASPLPSKTASSVRGPKSASPNGAPGGWHPSSESHPRSAPTVPRSRTRAKRSEAGECDGSVPRTSHDSIDSCGSADVLHPRARNTCACWAHASKPLSSIAMPSRTPCGNCRLPRGRVPNARRPRISRTTNFLVSLLTLQTSHIAPSALSP
jgi:hypothetical protein